MTVDIILSICFKFGIRKRPLTLPAEMLEALHNSRHFFSYFKFPSLRHQWPVVSAPIAAIFITFWQYSSLPIASGDVGFKPQGL